MATHNNHESSTATVKCWTEQIDFPTYLMGPDEQHPIFKDFGLPGMRRLRSLRSVYPYTLLDRFTHNRQNRTYQGIWLENEFIKVLVMPELRGRLQGAIDKRNGWDFLYFNHVIKPADIASRRAWISGGIEWNHPGGHGYTQFERISHKIIEEADGSKTVLVAEIEPVRMMKWETAITLRPGRLFVETEGRLSSIAPYPVPFASSQNAAMHASDDMEMIYPKNTHVTGHGKKTASLWPYMEGDIDLSWFRNVKHGLSLFVEGIGLQEDYWGCYSHDPKIDAGTVVVADHRTAPGKKYFSWGSHPHGRSWDTHLSDEDGPYVELQVQAYYDNLGYGNAWLNPLESKSFTIYWYPIKELGGFVKATRDVCLNVTQPAEDGLKIAVQATKEIPDARVIIRDSKATLSEHTTDLHLAEPYTATITLPVDTVLDDCVVDILDGDSKSVLSYPLAEPEPVEPRLAPPKLALEEMSLDQLYAYGKSFYQDPWGTLAKEAFHAMLKRDPAESRAQRALGWIAYHRGQFEDARKHFVESLENDQLNQGYDAFFALGLIAINQNDKAQAKECFTIASRHQSHQVTALYYLAVIAIHEQHYEQAVDYITEATDQGCSHPDPWGLAVTALRKLGRSDQALKVIQKAEALDPLYFPAFFESWFLAGPEQKGKLESEIHRIFDRRDEIFIGSQLYIEQAIWYINLEAWDDAVAVLSLAIEYYAPSGETYPMLWYYLGYCRNQMGDETGALQAFERAASINAPYVFPYRTLSIDVLRCAQEDNPSDGLSQLHLGNLYFYLHRHQDAVRAWEQAAELRSDDARVYRNLANATWFIDQDEEKTTAYLEKALVYDPGDATLYYELDHLYKTAGKTETRLAWLENNEQVVCQRDDLVLRWIDLLLRVGRYRKAAELLDTVRFSPREMRIRVAVRYTEAHYGVGLALLDSGDPQAAIQQFELGHRYPDHLSESAPAVPVWTRFHRLMALSFEASGDHVKSRAYWQKVLDGPSREGSESIIDQAVAYQHLDQPEKAREIYQRIIDIVDPDNSVGKYLLSCGYAGLGNKELAASYLQQALEHNPGVVLEARIEASYVPQR